jgi:hypothetical protein
MPASTGFQRSDFLTCCVLHMALIKNYLPMLWRKDTCQKNERKAVMLNMSRLLALKTLIGPYIDRKLAKKVLATWMRDRGCPAKGAR